MFEVRDHESTLSSTERLYYSNYEYYNDYEDLQAQYKHDLSKLRFSTPRKNTASIILYDWFSRFYSDTNDRFVKSAEPRPHHHMQLFKNVFEQVKTMQDIVYRFVNAYHENNYSDVKPDREEAKQQFQIVVFKFMYPFFEGQFSKTEQADYATLSAIIERMNELGMQKKEKLQELYNQDEDTRAESVQFLERWYAFEEYWLNLVNKKLTAADKQEKVDNYYLFEHCQHFKNIVGRMGSGQLRNVLLMAQPCIPSVNTVLHPLTVPLSFAYPPSSSEAPRVAFINLDNRETYLNVRMAANLPPNVRYISVFREPFGHQMNEYQQLQKQCEFQIDPDYANINVVHSELLFRQQSNSSNVFLYPLNSIHLRKTFSEMHQTQPISQRRIPVLESSEDIRWLWEQVIAGQVQEWKPQIVIVSYNGSLELKEHDFSAIIRSLTILCDHRILLFTNMTGIFRTVESAMEEEMDQEEEEGFDKDKVQMMEEFFTKYVTYDYSQVDQQVYFTNLALFIKISSGAHSLAKPSKNHPLGRYTLGRRMMFMERMAQLPNYRQKLFGGGGVTGSEFQRLMDRFALRELGENQKEAHNWESKVESVYEQLLELNYEEFLDEQQAKEEMDQEMRRNQREVAYRIKVLKSELQVEEFLVHGEGMDANAEFEQYLKRGKQKLMLQYLEGYRFKGVYLGEEEPDCAGRIRSYRFTLEDGEELTLSPYSQVIPDDKKNRIFIINYKQPDDRHIILQGQRNERVSGAIKMHKVQGRLDQQLTRLSLEGRQGDFVRINYSHCMVRDKLYLFWPQEWDLREEIRRKMLGMDYNPPHKNYMLRVYYNQQDKNFLIDHLKWTEGGIPPVPRKGCLGMQTANENRFYILGGIYDSRMDFYATSGMMNVAILQAQSFNIQSLPKRKQRSIQKSNCLKPKMNYRLERGVRGGEQGGGAILSGGYGRIFTNTHALITYESYSMINELDTIRVAKLEKKNMRMVRLQKSLSLAAVGRYPVGSTGQSEERFSDAVKDWALSESRESVHGQRKILSVLEQDLRTREFKTDQKRQYLFGWDRTLRQRIYVPHCWSPELQIVAGGRLYLVNTALKAEKSDHYNINRFIIPKQEDVISMCLEEDKLLMLAPAPLLPQLDTRVSIYTLYEGSLANLNDLLLRRELHLQERFEFKLGQPEHSLTYKTIFSTDDRIYILGGLPSSQGPREDYLLEYNKNRLKLKMRKLESKDDNLEMTWPVVVKHDKGFVMYSLISEERIIPGGGDFQAVEDFWRVKMETFTPNDSAVEESTCSAPLSLFQLDFDKVRAVGRRPEFDKPRMVKIAAYQRFTYSQLRQSLQKVLMGLAQVEDMSLQSIQQVLKSLFSQRNEAGLTELIKEHHHKGNTFKELVSWFERMIQNESADREQHNELARDIRELYSLLNKHLIEGVLPPDYSSQQLYRFVVEDQKSKKVKYMAIGPLMTTKLQFLRLRYKHELSVCLNESREEEMFFSSSGIGCEELTKERARPYNPQYLEEEPKVKKITVSYGQPQSQ